MIVTFRGHTHLIYTTDLSDFEVTVNRVKSCNFGPQVNSDSDLVCFIYIFFFWNKEINQLSKQ